MLKSHLTYAAIPAVLAEDEQKLFQNNDYDQTTTING